jgi:hypothetical protein
LLIPIPLGFLCLRFFSKTLFETADSLAKAFPHLREALRAKDEKRSREDDDKLLSAETKHKLSRA